MFILVSLKKLLSRSLVICTLMDSNKLQGLLEMSSTNILVFNE